MYYSGIDLLKIISMLSIITHHILLHGNILYTASGAGYAIGYFLEIMCCYGVNAYALTTGFLSYRKKHSLSKYLLKWFEVVFWGICISVSAYALGYASFSDIFQAMLPVSTKQYWYFTAYTGVSLLMPVLDRLAEAVDRQSLPKVVLVIILFSCYNSGIGRISDPFFLNNGYSFIWLSILYFLGALIKKFELYKEIDGKRKKQIGVAIFGMILISWVWFVYLADLIRPGMKSLLTVYVSPTILGVSVGLLFILAGTNFKSKWITFLSSSTFGIYLVHDSNIVRNYFVIGRFAMINQFSPVWMAPIVFLCAVAIFAVCCLLDQFRVLLFKLLQARRLSVFVESFLLKFIQKITECPVKERCIPDAKNQSRTK